MRPRIRLDCLPGGVNEARPCPWSSCRYHLNHSKESCVLDVADENGASIEEISEYTGISREQVRQLEFMALRKLKRARELRELV